MHPFRFHVFVCDQQKPEGVPCCAARGSGQVLEALRREVAARGLVDTVQVTACGSLGLCEHGPNPVGFPQSVRYSGVTPADVPEIVRSHFQEDTPVARLVCADAAALRGEILNNREKMLAARRAREAAGVLPDDLNERIRAFQESRVVLTALELDVFTAVGDGAGAVEVAASLRTDPRATEMLLNALASLRLLVKREGVFRNSPETARYFTAGSGDDARPALLHTAHLWQRWSTLTDCVRAGTAVARATVEPIARRHIQQAGVADRVKVRAGDLRCDSLGEGYDLVFVSAICHMLSSGENLDLLRRCRGALAPGGRIVIQDFILEPDKTAPRFRS